MSTRSNKKPVKNTSHNIKDLLAVRECLSLLDDHKVTEAKELCAQILKRASNLVFANHAWGLIALHENNYIEAEKALRKAIKADPDNAEYLTNLGGAVLNQDRVDEAIAIYEKAIEINTESKEA